LHSHKANKKAILNELERTLTLGRPKVGDGGGDLDALLATRERLNEYCVALNTPVGESAVTPYHALGEFLRMMRLRPSPPLPSLALAGIDSWSAKVFRHNLALVEELQGQLQVTGPPTAHPFWGSGRLSLLPSEDADIQATLSAAAAGLRDARTVAERLSMELGHPAPLSPSEARSLLAIARRVAMAPDVRGLALASPDWLDREQDVRRAILSGAQLQHLHKQFDAVLNPTAWQADVTDLRATMAGLGGKWWRGLSGKYRGANQLVRDLFRTASPESLGAVLAALDAIMEAQREFADHQRLEQLGAGLFGTQWRGAETDWPRLVSTLDFIAGVHREGREGRLPTWILDALSRERSAGLGATATELEAELLRMTNSLVGLLTLLEMTGELALGETQLEKRPFTETAARIASWVDRRTELHDIVGLNQLSGACKADGLSGVVDSLESDPVVVTGLVNAFRRSYYSALYERALRERPVLAQTDSQRQDQLAKRFRELDRLTLELTRARIARAHWERLPRQDWAGQLAVLRRQFNMRTRHLPIRRLMGEAGNAIQAIKPVFMMSPLSIAAFLAPASVKFDLVVFDEASQVKPVDAFGAIVRARQAVVVGDDQQLPPTNFFDSLVDADDREEDDVTGDIESILGLFRSQGAKPAMLKWHYRSRHESLIAVSNHEFYDDKLVVFPSPDGGRRELGLRYHHVPEGIYDRGKSRKNVVEAKVVAEAVMDHARAQADRPMGEQLTLGVVAFSAAQMEAI
jgi:AAA domain